MGMAGNYGTVSYYDTTSSIGDIWAYDGTGGRFLIGNYPRPRARIPKELKAMLIDPKVVYLAQVPVWARKVYPDGHRSPKFVMHADSLMTIGMASDIETGRIQFWASERSSRSSYLILSKRSEEMMTSTPPEALVRHEVKKWRDERQRPLTVTTASISYAKNW